MRDYTDAYDTCICTYATICVSSNDIQPHEITNHIGVEPTSFAVKGELRSTSAIVKNRNYHTNLWFYSTKGNCESRDCRRHLDQISENVLKSKIGLATLRGLGCSLDVAIYYEYTQGGPTISPRQMAAFAEADIDVWWDLYRGNEIEAGT